MVDMAGFLEDDFDAKAWVNSAARARHTDEDSERYLGDLEMKLQLAAEAIESSLNEQSNGALHRIPRAQRDASRLHDDAVALRSSIATMLLKLKQAEGLSGESVAAIARLHSVKKRMESAHKTLKDAAGLAELCASVETVFASGDLPQAAETLANMRRCLAVVGEVPEFAGVKRDLEALENRLDGMVQTRLTDALSLRKVDAVQGFRDILKVIGRYSSLEQQYTKVRMKPLRKLWDEFDAAKSLNALPTGESGTSFQDWLPEFYDQMLLSLDQEMKWCILAFPVDFNILIPRLLIDTMSSISGSFTNRIEAAFARPGESGGSTLGLLLLLHNLTTTFAKNVERALSSISIDDKANVLKAIYAPYESFKQRYGDLERAQLSAEVGRLDLRGAIKRAVRGVELSETVQRIEASIPEITTFLEAAVERCISFTGGSELEFLLKTLDEVILQYISSLHDILKSLRPFCLVSHEKKQGTEGNTIPEDEEWSIVQGALHLVTVAESLASRLSVFEAGLRGTIGRLGGHLLANTAPRLDIASLRLSDTREKARRLAGLCEQASDPRFHPLTLASQRVGAFVDAVNELVYEVLISKVRAKLENVAGMKEWNAVEEHNEFALPTFSSYPLSYVTSIGEYLLALPQQLLPQQLEHLAGAETSEDGQYFATEWMFKVAEGAAALYIEQIRGIPSLSKRGAQQLAADIEYLCNVLSLLSMNVPQVLSTFHACVSAPRDKLAEMATVGDSELDNATVRLVCKMRNLSIMQ